ncbi:MAG TPA: ribose-phosphate pyrophosphokinase [Chloroflexota bacterium]|nr:ribose-phosphate pyrophosphokinase [Chloroflexota bacterium]
MYSQLSIFSGNANRRLAEEICAELGISLGQAEVFQFSNENIFVKILDRVREHDVYVVQSFSSPVNVSIMELLIMLDALKRASAARITAVIPYYAYGRTDKKDQPRVPITARLLADLVTRAGANRVLSMSLHAPQIQGFFDIPVDELTATPILSRYFAEKHQDDWVVVAPDLGAAKRARNFAQRIGASLAVIEKRRLGNAERSEVINVIGEVRGRRAIIFDDEIDTAGSVTGAARAVAAGGALEIYAACTHGVLSGPAIERLEASSIRELVITNTVPLPPDKQVPKITVLSVASLFADAIHRIHTGGSVGALFR